MANVVRHRFASGKPDGADGTQVQPSHWNDGHAFIGGNAGDLLTRDPTDATWGAIWAAPALAPVVISPITGTVNDWVSGAGGKSAIILWTGATDATITGIAGGVSGQVLTFKSRGSGILRFANNDPGSIAANRLINFATSAPTPLALNGTAVYGNVGGTWYLLSHDQGSWIQPPYQASHYSAAGSMIWTVESGDRIAQRYRLRGNTLDIMYYIVDTTIGGTLSNAIYIDLQGFGGFQSNALGSFAGSHTYTIAAQPEALGRIMASAGRLEIQRVGLAVWDANTNLMRTQGFATFEVV